MITMIFQNAQNDTRFVMCNKAHVNAFVWDMNDKGYNWVSTKVSLLFKKQAVQGLTDQPISVQ